MTMMIFGPEAPKLPRLHVVRIENDARRLSLEIPPDTRDITAKTFGDPLPGRSALDAKGGVYDFHPYECHPAVIPDEIQAAPVVEATFNDIFGGGQ